MSRKHILAVSLPDCALATPLLHEIRYVTIDNFARFSKWTQTYRTAVC